MALSQERATRSSVREQGGQNWTHKYVTTDI